MLRTFTTVLISTICIGAYNIAEARILNVPDEWESIQLAIDEADSSDTVLVAPGQYVGGLDLDGEPITLASWILTTGDPAYIDSTIIEAAMERTVLRIDGGTRQTSLIKGFTIRRGRASYGGGINCRPYTKPSFEDLVIRECVAPNQGGGLYLSRDAEAHLLRVKILENEAGLGGGIGCFISSVFLDSCEIRYNQADNGTAIGMETFNTLSLRNTLIQGNHGGATTIFDNSGSGNNLYFDHVTMADNPRFEDPPNFSIRLTITNGRVLIANSILWDTTDQVLNIAGLNYRGVTTDVSYSLIRGIEGRGEGNVFSVGLINQDPRFVAPARGDFRLSWDSPCIDAGNPDSTEDRDGSRCDIGVFPLIRQYGWLEGEIQDRDTNQPLSGATVTVLEDEDTLALAVTDSSGAWAARIHLPDDARQLSFVTTKTLYHPYRLDGVDLSTNDTLSFRTVQTALGVRFNTESVTLATNPGDSTRARFFIANEDRDTVVWQSKLTSPDPILREEWAIEDTINLTELLDDTRIQGVNFIGDRLYVTGANDDDPNIIYVLDRQHALVDSFYQPQLTRYGMKELEWDGEFIWASEDDSVFAFNMNGEIQYRFGTGVNPIQCTAYDIGEGIFWLSGITGSTRAYDREGNDLNRSIEYQGLRKYGFAIDHDDPDGYCLYANVRAPVNPMLTRLMKIDTATGDTMVVNGFEPTTNTYLGLSIVNNYNRIGGSSLLWINDRPANIGNRFDAVAIDPYNGWFHLEPTSGILAPEDEVEITVSLTALTVDGAPFDSAHYHIDYHLEIAGDAGGEVILPIDLYVGVEPPVGVSAGEGQLPEEFAITALYPNPFNSSLTVRYTLGRTGNVKISLTDILGRQAAVLMTHTRLAGNNRETFSMDGLASGVYYLNVQSAGAIRRSKVILLK